MIGGVNDGNPSAVRCRVPRRRSSAQRGRLRGALPDVARVAAGAPASARRHPAAGGRAMALSLTDLDLRGVSEAIADRDVTCVAATETYLQRIQTHDRVLQSFITVMADQALARAKAADTEIERRRQRGPLHGVPVALKDLIAVAGVRMTAGSRVLDTHVPAHDAFVTRRLDDAGAVILGKL